MRSSAAAAVSLSLSLGGRAGPQPGLGFVIHRRPSVHHSGRVTVAGLAGGRGAEIRGVRADQLAVGGPQVVGGHGGEVFGGRGLAQAHDADVAVGAGPFEQGTREPAVAELVDAALCAARVAEGLVEDDKRLPVE